MQLFVVLLFLLTYFLVIMFRKKALHIIYVSVGVLLLTRVINLSSAWQGINFNVLGIFLGTMILSSLFIYSGVPAYITDIIVKHTKRVYIAFLAICALSAFISAFTENVATVLIVAPLAIEICKRMKINPVLLLIGVSISSNLQGTATLIGDAPSIILAMETGMNFNNFFWFHGNPGIFFAVEFGAIGAFLVLYLFYKKFNGKLKDVNHKSDVKSWTPTVLLVLMTINLAIQPILPWDLPLAIICIFWAIIGLIWHEIYHKESISLVKDLDWYTLFFLAGIFILIFALVESGVIESLANYLALLSGGSALKAYIIIVTFSVIISAFVDNIPYTIAMIPVAQLLAQKTGLSQYVFVYGLLIGTCLGGNITPIGSASNVVTLGLLRKERVSVKTWDFVRLGVPFTIIAVIMGAFFVWIVWS